MKLGRCRGLLIEYNRLSAASGGSLMPHMRLDLTGRKNRWLGIRPVSCAQLHGATCQYQSFVSCSVVVGGVARSQEEGGAFATTELGLGEDWNEGI